MDITDVSGYPGHATELFTPKDEQELSTLLARASSENIPVTIQGALTGMAGGAAPQGSWAISMRNSTDIKATQGSLQAGAGASLKDVQSAAASTGQFYAPDPTENTSSIGGNIAANAS